MPRGTLTTASYCEGHTHDSSYMGCCECVSPLVRDKSWNGRGAALHAAAPHPRPFEGVRTHRDHGRMRW